MEINLNRDYTNNPLKRGELPEKDDVKFLFLVLNLSREECAKICNCNPEKIKIVCQQNKFQKTKEQKAELRKLTNLRKYGVENISQLDVIKQKKKETCRTNYGVDNPAQSKQIYNKIKETCKTKYGVESTNCLDWKKQKISKTLLQKYGVGNIMQSDKMKEHFKQIAPETQAKSYKTKKKNKTFNTSQPEQQIKILLEKIFTVNYQYKSDSYPFACDFYIVDLDLYIEYNGTWTHGGMPFQPNKECNMQLQEWKEKAKTSKFYENAIETWTIRDVQKRQIAKEHNLNWIEFFSITEFKIWYKQLCENLK